MFYTYTYQACYMNSKVKNQMCLMDQKITLVQLNGYRLVAFNEKYSFLVLNSTIFIALYTIKIEKTEIDYEYRQKFFVATSCTLLINSQQTKSAFDVFKMLLPSIDLPKIVMIKYGSSKSIRSGTFYSSTSSILKFINIGHISSPGHSNVIALCYLPCVIV